MDDYEWTVKIKVSPVWVADGFDLDKDRLLEMIAHDLDHAHSFEFDGEILSAPDPKQIQAEQGYKVEGYEPRMED